MRELAILAFVTVDGVMQAPSMADEDRSGGFDGGGWAAPYWEGVMPHVEETAMSTPYDVLFGRKTYDLFAGHWPNAPRSKANERLNSARKFVATSSPLGTEWENSEVLTGEVVPEIARLKSQDGPLIQVHGSAQLIQALTKHDLIDEFRIWTFPVLVGKGKRLFEGEHPPRDLTLVSAEGLTNGVVSQVYRTAR
ncbi:dihydrofolate reductase family protein [uncultured Tateyamaria sp.]|uniref:dihydrofolate reductase family protein n=1 Tax=uncultured Tateyamaria sp. TaxID=455651 RepID=UPI0026314BF1|nr:dihydrofolate reductase family protein [uncultured Tateyamaria sp.]